MLFTLLHTFQYFFVRKVPNYEYMANDFKRHGMFWTLVLTACVDVK
jgi:hypothetical protein